jgi:serine/threonine protein kinase
MDSASSPLDETVRFTPFGSADGKGALPVAGTTRDPLLTYHTSLGQPLPEYTPPEEIRDLCWNARYGIRKMLGKGAQGVVYLARREGADGYFTNVALKVFYRNPAQNSEEYLAEMVRIARQAQRVSRVQHDNLISIRDFVTIADTRVMVLEWIDGLDLSRLLEPARYIALARRFPKIMWEHLNDVIVTAGEDHCRLKPGIAVDILRGCLAGLSSLHQRGIVHCDLKPSNIMIKRAGTKKIIDIDSSCVPAMDPPTIRGTPYYMAPEQLRGKSSHLPSDMASLGYLLVEMLTGRRIFKGCETVPQLLEAKMALPVRLEKILPKEVLDDSILSGLIAKLVAVEPRDRFPDADAAELDRNGAVNFHRHLVKSNLSTEYDRELAWWLGLLAEGPENGNEP